MIVIMFKQNFNPYGQFPAKSNQLYEEEYEEEDSEPLVEEVDDTYEPTEKEVREYAIETLGMNLPEDEGLLYLAREGLKAPLPPNWVPYQSKREGEVYYKHRITQQKTYDHPTDIQYMKKYEQQKQKMARKNLKSMNMKGSSQIGMSPNSNLYGNSSLNFANKSSNNSALMAGSSNIGFPGSQPPSQIKLDPRLEQKYQEELEQLEEKLKKEWREFQQQETIKNQKKLKKSLEDYEAELDMLLKGKSSEVRVDDKIKSEKNKLKSNLEEQFDTNFQIELKQYQRGLQSKISDFVSVYEDDNRLKISKYQSEKDSQFEHREAKYQEGVNKAQLLKQNKKKQRQEVLAELQAELEGSYNQEIQQATAEALQQELQTIKETYQQKLHNKENDLQRQYDETKRVLGFDQAAYLSQVASKKSRMKQISEMKLQSIKKKEMQVVNTKFQRDFDAESSRLKNKYENELVNKLTEARQRLEQKLIRDKERLDLQMKQKSEAQLQNVYEQLKIKIKGYEGDMNKKLSNLNSKFISDIEGKANESNQDLTVRFEVKEKEMTLENKTQMVDSLRRQAKLQQITYELLRLQNELCKSSDSHEVDQKLIKLAKQHQLEYRTDEYLKWQQRYQQLRQKYKKDKEFLGSVMNSLQNHHQGLATGSAAVLKQYNQDVRTMRDNEQMLNKIELLLKKAQINDRAALNQLASNDFAYQQIQLKKQVGKTSLSQVEVYELGQESLSVRKQAYLNKGQDVESALRAHSKCLTNFRQQLNRKLYQLRSFSYY